jgi:hypothetical protein
LRTYEATTALASKTLLASEHPFLARQMTGATGTSLTLYLMGELLFRSIAIVGDLPTGLTLDQMKYNFVSFLPAYPPCSHHRLMARDTDIAGERSASDNPGWSL